MSVGAVVACCALAAACSPDQAPASTPSPTPAATTPAESQIERQMRLDYEAAEKAYRANMAEQDRLVPGGWRPRSRRCAQGHRDRALSTDQLVASLAISRGGLACALVRTTILGVVRRSVGRRTRVG